MMEPKKVDNVGADLCPTCANLTGQVLNQLINALLNGGVVGGCNSLCSNLDNKLESTVCNMVCDIAGIKAFAWALEKADLDPIYMCQLLKICPHSDLGKAEIKELSVNPTTGKLGDTFIIAVGFEVFNSTSVGTFHVAVDGPGASKSQTQSLNEGFEPGQYSLDIKYATSQKNNLPGPYNVTIEMCDGTCGSNHPWSGLLDQGATSFTLTI